MIIDLSPSELDVILNALQTWKIHTAGQFQTRQEGGWLNEEQNARIQAIDNLQERLFALSPAPSTQ